MTPPQKNKESSAIQILFLSVLLAFLIPSAIGIFMAWASALIFRVIVSFLIEYQLLNKDSSLVSKISSFLFLMTEPLLSKLRD